MDSLVKQRLVGALILVALAVVFWPIIFVPSSEEGGEFQIGVRKGRVLELRAEGYFVFWEELTEPTTGEHHEGSAAIFEYDSVSLGIKKGHWGEIAEVFPNRKFLVITPGGTRLVHGYHCNGFIPRPGLLFACGGVKIKRFARNQQGGYDLHEDSIK